MRAPTSLPASAPRSGIFRPVGRHIHFPVVINRLLLRTWSAALILCLSATAAEIHDAVRHGDAAGVSRLLKRNSQLVNLPDEEHGATPLYLAVDAGNPEIVGILLKAGAKVNVTTNDGMTPALRAAAVASEDITRGFPKILNSLLNSSAGPARAACLKDYRESLVISSEEEASRLTILRLLVERGANLSEATGDLHGTPLHMAIMIPNIKAVGILLGHGADIEASPLVMRPLHFATLLGNTAIVKVLIAHKADVNATLPNGIRPLHFAVCSGDVESIRLLLDNGAEINAVDKKGAPALHQATWSDEIFNLLIDRGADPNLQRSDGTTTLHVACHDGSKALVEKLLQLHPDLDAWDGQEFTPLIIAAQAGRLDLMKLLVNAGAYLKATQIIGLNALHFAAGSASPEAVQYLLDQKMDIDEQGNTGVTALVVAAAYGRAETVELLLRAGANVNGVKSKMGVTPLMNAAIGRSPQQSSQPSDAQPARDPDLAPAYLKIAKLLLDGGADLQARSGEGLTALHYAATTGNVEVLELLISRGAEVNDRESRYGYTPLHQAAYRADVKTVAALLDRGAGIAATATEGLQPVHRAASRNDPAVLDFLLEKGADMSATEIHGATPLHLAVLSGNLETARALLEHGAPAGALDKQKQSPLHLAASNGTVEIVRLLVDHRAPVNGADHEGLTPLHRAAILRGGKAAFDRETGWTVNIDVDDETTQASLKRSKPEDKLMIVKLLLANGARPQAKSQVGVTPVELAEKFGSPEIVALLKSQTSSPSE